MDLQSSLDELEISLDEIEITNINKDYIKRKYHQMALKWHPDKNKDKDNIELHTIKFQRVNEAYSFLKKELNIINGDSDDDSEDISNTFNEFVSSPYSKESKLYINILTNFLSSLFKGSYNHILLTITKELILSYDKITLGYLTKQFEKLDKQRSIELYQILYKYKDILYINSETLELVSSVISDKYKNDMLFILKPKLQDIIEHNIYKLFVNDKLYLVPLWHNELYFDAEDGSDIIVLCEPDLPSNITIDENNNIYYEKNIKIQDELSYLINNEKFVSIEIGNKWFSIPLNKLYLKKEQLYRFKSQGISQISEKDMYNVSSKSDVIIKIILS
jgi:curved DNA-binding protein CbpA